MGWRDAPLVQDEKPKWMSAPLVELEKNVENIGEVGDIPEEMRPVGTAEDVFRSLATGLRQGTEAMVGLPGDVATALEYGGSKIGEMFGADPSARERIGKALAIATSPVTASSYLGNIVSGKDTGSPTTTRNIQQQTQKLAGDPYTPQTTSGEYAKTVGEFIPAAIAGPGSAGRNVAQNVGRNALLYGAIPATTSETAGQLTRGTKTEPYARLTGALLGGGLSSRIGGIPKLTSPSERGKVLEAAQRLNVDIPNAAMPDSPTFQRIAGALKELPVAGRPIQKASEKTVAGLSREAEKLSAPGSNVQSAGGRAGDALHTALEDMKAKSDVLYKNVDRYVDPSIKRPLSSTEGLVNKMLREKRASTSTASDPAIKLVEDAITRPEGLNYEGLKQLRTDIGARLNGKIIPEPGTSQPALKRLYGALKNDLKETIKLSGPKAYKAWEYADKSAKKIADQRESLTKIIGIKGDASEGAIFSRVVGLASDTSRGSIRKLREAKNIMNPSAWDEITATMIGKMGRDPRQGTDYFSPARFLTAYEKYSDEAKKVLFGANKRNLDDIATISRSAQKIEQWGNPSGTGRTVLVAGGILQPFKALLGVVTGGTASYLLARPATAKKVVAWSRLASQKDEMGRTAYFAATRELAKSIADKTGENPEILEQKINKAVTRESLRGALR